MFDQMIHLGDVLTFVGIAVTLFIFHSKNVQRFTNIETKVSVIFKWFENNVIGRGESPRSREQNKGD